MAFKVIAGLGNPGPGYEQTRHNVGFMLLNKLVSANNGIWKRKFDSEIAEIRFAGTELLAVKPQTFMNRSGEPLRALMQFYKLDLSGLVVAHDEVDLDFGTIRLKQGGGAAGHNGIKSIVTELSGADFIRIRLGVGRPPVVQNSSGIEVERELADWVLGRFDKESHASLNSMLDRAVSALEVLVVDGIKVAQNKFN